VSSITQQLTQQAPGKGTGKPGHLAASNSAVFSIGLLGTWEVRDLVSSCVFPPPSGTGLLKVLPAGDVTQ
jgi:hypothetical protein